MAKTVKSSQRQIASLQGMSLQQRLPLLMCILLFTVMIAFSIASYYGIRKASLEMGEKRLQSLTGELSTMLSQSSVALNATILNVVQQDTVKEFVKSGGSELRAETSKILKGLIKDSTWALLKLFNSDKIALLSLGDNNAATKLPVEKIFASLNPGPGQSRVGKIYARHDSMYYPIVATVAEKNEITGYLVIWRSLSSDSKGVKQLSLLIGTGSELYLGNADGSLWTNLMKPISSPPIDTLNYEPTFKYKDAQGENVIAALKPIANTPWQLMIKFPEKIVLEPATSFLQWMILAGLLIIAVGIFATWLMSRNIIRPLNTLTKAASAIAAGDYTVPVATNRKDEVGKLAETFNYMTSQLQATQAELENKVSQRTEQLQAANGELESFAYSISHDLRAPLRGIVGFTSILEEEYNDKLDAEGKRLISIVKNNTLKMGNLIDDLLAFSRLGRNEITKTQIDTNAMVEEVISNSNAKFSTVWEIQKFPAINGDTNTLRQVWINLISNAVKYSRNQDAPHIQIGVNRQENQNIFFIKDNGVGFKQQYQSKLFKVFQRLHNEKEFEGTGVGLAIVEKIISRHGGKVWAEAEEGKGASFFFSIPDQFNENNIA